MIISLWGDFVWGFSLGSFCPAGYYLGGFCPVPICEKSSSK